MKQQGNSSQNVLLQVEELWGCSALVVGLGRRFSTFLLHLLAHVRHLLLYLLRRVTANPQDVSSHSVHALKAAQQDKLSLPKRGNYLSMGVQPASTGRHRLNMLTARQQGACGASPLDKQRALAKQVGVLGENQC